MQKLTPLERLIQYFGSQEKASEKMGISPQLISFWKVQGYIPGCRGTFVMRKTKGTIKNYEVWIEADKFTGAK